MPDLGGGKHLDVDAPAGTLHHALGEAHCGDVDGVLRRHLVGHAKRIVLGLRRPDQHGREKRGDKTRS